MGRQLVTGADPGIFYWGGGGANFGSGRTVEFFCDQLRKQRRPRVSLFVNASLHWCGKYCFASRGEQIIGGFPKTITFLNIPGN